MTQEEQKDVNKITAGVTSSLQANYANPFQNQIEESRMEQPSAKVDYNFKIHKKFIKKCPSLFFL